jgi:iron complex outermembrane recepter protein
LNARPRTLAFLPDDKQTGRREDNLEIRNLMKVALLASAATVCIPVLGQVAVAQTESASGDDADLERKLDTVVVSSTKREESIQNVSISMQVVQGDNLRDEAVSDLKQLSTLVPGITFYQSPTIPALSMRGFASPSSNPASDQTVALYTDGIFAGRARQFQAPFFDVERIEVLRGPQGALLGKNTSTGAISIITGEPEREFEAEWRGTLLLDRVGIDTNGFVTGPITDNLSGRLAYSYIKTTEGWLDNLATGNADPRSDIKQARASLLWEPTSSFETVAKLEVSDMHEHGRPAARFDGTVPLEDVIEFERNAEGVFGVEDGTTLQNKQFSNTATWDIGDFSLVSITGYAAYEAGNVGGGGANTPEVFGTTLFEDFEQYSQELRLLSPADARFSWIIGAYADESSYQATYFPRYNVLGIFNGLGQTDFDQDATSYSAYATGTYNVTDALRVIGGVRWTEIEKEADFSLVQVFGLPLGYSAPLYLDGKISDSSVDPSVTVEYDVSDTVMIYGGFSRGSKGGAFQGANRQTTEDTFALEPEESEGFEVGLKSTFGDWLALNISAYQLTITNLQTGQYVGNPPALINVNAGEARTRGVEWSAYAYLGGQFTVDFTGSYIDGTYLDYPGAPCTYQQQQVGCVNGSVNAKGRGFNVPPWQLSLGATYETPFTDDVTFKFAPRVEYRSRQIVDAGFRNPYFGFQEAYAKVDFRMAIEDNDGRWEVAVLGKNIFDKATTNAAFAWGFPFAPTQGATVQVEPARSLGIQFTLRR